MLRWWSHVLLWLVGWRGGGVPVGGWRAGWIAAGRLSLPRSRLFLRLRLEPEIQFLVGGPTLLWHGFEARRAETIEVTDCA